MAPAAKSGNSVSSPAKPETGRPGDGSATAFPHLRVRIRGRPQPVEMANVPSDHLAIWMVQELAGFDPAYLFLTTDGEQLPVSEIVSLCLPSGETPFVPVNSIDPRPFRAVNVRLKNTGEDVEIANIPMTPAGEQMVRRLLSADGTRDRASYRNHDFLATDLGWRRIRDIDPDRIAFDPGRPVPAAPPVPADEIADGSGYERVPLLPDARMVRAATRLPSHRSSGSRRRR